jgi:hypothetical protein
MEAASRRKAAGKSHLLKDARRATAGERVVPAPVESEDCAALTDASGKVTRACGAGADEEKRT